MNETRTMTLRQKMPAGIKKGQQLGACIHFPDGRGSKIVPASEVPGLPLPDKEPVQWAGLCGECLKLYRIIQ